MSIDFFDAACQEPPINNVLFGICDDQNGTKAYTNLNEPTKWIATVKNNNHHNLTFTAIDKCIFKDGEQEDRKRCDGMLTSSQHIYFIELKEIEPPWISHAIEQLEYTSCFNYHIPNFRNSNFVFIIFLPKFKIN